MTIKDFYEGRDLPKEINIITKDKKHPYIGPYSKAPEWVLKSEYIEVTIKTLDNSNHPQVTFYI